MNNAPQNFDVALALTRVGQAVMSVQAFESVLALAYNFYKFGTDPKRTDAAITAGIYKIPVANIVKALGERGDIDGDLEERLKAFVEDRHLLIHRWLLQRGPQPLGGAAESAYAADLDAMAAKVIGEANALTRILGGSIRRLEAPPDETDLTEFRKATAAIFRITEQLD
jgi:hypothetical protein